MLSLHKLARYTKSTKQAIFDPEKHWSTRAQLDGDVDHQSVNNQQLRLINCQLALLILI